MSQKVVADLHNHSTASDGELSPVEVVEQAAKKGLEAVALTDHDTLSGLAEALQVAPRFGIKVIPGVELTLRLCRPAFVGSLHLLLYFSPEKLIDKEFLKNIETLFAAGRGPALVRDRVESINQFFGPDSATPILKRPLATTEIKACADNITRRHFAKVLSENHHLERHQVGDIIANRSPAYLPSGIDPARFLPLRRNFPLLAFLAHPAAGSFPPPSHYREVLPPWPIVAELLKEFMAPEPIAIDGLEIEYPGHREKEKKILRELAANHKLLVSGGSDGHDFKERPYGVAGINREDFSRFMAKYEELKTQHPTHLINPGGEDKSDGSTIDNRKQGPIPGSRFTSDTDNRDKTGRIKSHKKQGTQRHQRTPGRVTSQALTQRTRLFRVSFTHRISSS